MESPSARLDFTTTNRLDFEPPDEVRFPALRLARDALIAGAHAPCIMNAANEVAVDAFLKGLIRFCDIAVTVERMLDSIPARNINTMDDVFALDGEARAKAMELTAQAAE